MKRGIEQIEVWNLGSSSKLHVVYKINKVKFDKKIEIIKSYIEDNGPNKEKNITKETTSVRIPRENEDREIYEDNNNLSSKPSINDKKILNFSKSPNYPKKISSLFNKLKNKITDSEKVIDKNELEKKNKVPTNNNSNSFNNTTVPVALNSLVLVEFESVDLNNFENKNNYSLFKDSFVEGFFIAGLPEKKAKIINDYEHLIPNCKHKICSELPAYKPDILKKIIYGDTTYDDEGKKNSISNYNKSNNSQQVMLAKFDLTQTTTNLCFPHGIKLCYHKYEDEIYPIPNFTTITTNESGRHHYIYVYNYFQKISLIDFKNLYDVDPVTDYNRVDKKIQTIVETLKKSETYLISPKKLAKLEDKYEEIYMLSCELASRDYIYIPQCASLVSKLPYNNQMEKAINALMKMTVDEKISSDEINKFLLNIIYEIPIPPINKKLLFYVPYTSKPIEITGRIYKDLPINNNNLSSLFKYFLSETIVNIYYLILFEQKLLFVYDDYQALTEISQLFINLIYPIEWIHTYIPIISEEMTKYLKSFMPFIMGIDNVLFNHFIKNEHFDEDNNIFIIHINNNRKSTIETSNDYLKNKKVSNKKIMKYLPDIPDETYKDVVKHLDRFRKIYFEIIDKKLNSINSSAINVYDNSNNIKNIEIIKIDKQIKTSFIKSMALLIGDYKKYVSFIDDSNYFNSDSFLQSRSNNYLNFYKEFIETGMFKNFLNNFKQDSYLYFDKICNRLINLILCKSNLSKRNKISRETNSFGGKYFLNSENKSDRNFGRSNSIKIESRAQKPRRNDSDLKMSSNLNNDKNPKKIFESPNPSIRPPYQVIPFSKSNNAENLTPNDGSFSLSNELNSDTNSINENKSSEQNESYLIMPFFLNNQIKSVIPIEDILTEKFKYASDKNHYTNILTKKKIFTSDTEKKFVFENFPKKFRNYIIPGTELNFDTMNDKIKLGKNYSEDFNSININSLLNENMKEVINDYLKNIISSENFSNVNKFELKNAIKNKYGRAHFAKILFQNKFRENRSQILNEKGFEDLFHMVLYCLVACENEEKIFLDVIKITKSTFFYYKLGQGKDQSFIYMEIIKKTHPFSIWLNSNFWLKWFKMESEERNNDFINIEDFYFFLLSEIATYMNNLKIEIKFIIDCIVYYIGDSVIKKDKTLLKDLEKSIIKQKEFLSKEQDD